MHYGLALIGLFVNAVAAFDLAGLNSKVTINDDGTYFVSLGSVDFANGEGFSYVGAPPRLNTLDGRFDGALEIGKGTAGSGEDQLGHFTSYSQQWTYQQEDMLTTTFRVYEENSIATFEIQVHQTIENCSVGNENMQVLSFPTFRVDEPTTSRKAFFAVSGNMMSQYIGINEGLVDEWRPRRYIPGGFLAGYPLGLFDESKKSSLVMSPLDNFVIGSHYHDKSSDVQWYSSGIIGTLNTIPAGFTYTSGLFWANGGLNTAFEEWGKMLRAYYPISSTRPIAEDRTVQYLSYWTDNGVYYYYSPAGTYEQTLKSVVEYLDKEDIPIGAIQIDSWFYYRGDHNGILNWTSSPEVFPSGMDFLLDLDLPVVAHSRYWDTDNIYDVKNGGKYEFIVTDGKHSVPTEQQFWTDLMANGTKWGLAVYEQDWIYRQMTYVDDLMADTELAKRWLQQMGTAATLNGITVQYCGEGTRHLLEAIEIPSVTHARASGDYGKFNQWSISDTNMIIHALRILPFKDVFWSTPIQPGNPYDWGDHKPVEMCPEIEALVSTLSTGPVAFGDGIGYANKKLLMRSCMADGKLLKPSRPAVTPDSTFIQRAFRESGLPGAMMTTYSRIGEWRWDIMVGAVVLHENQLFPSDRVDLTSDEAGMSVVKFKRKNFSLLTPADKIYAGTCVPHPVEHAPFEGLSVFTEDSPIELETGHKCQYQLWETAPVFPDGTILLGELDKWVHVSPQRVLNIEISKSIRAAPVVTVQAVEGEVITLHYAHADDLSETYAVSCRAKETGTLTIRLSK